MDGFGRTTAGQGGDGERKACADGSDETDQVCKGGGGKNMAIAIAGVALYVITGCLAYYISTRGRRKGGENHDEEEMKAGGDDRMVQSWREFAYWVRYQDLDEDSKVRSVAFRLLKC